MMRASLYRGIRMPVTPHGNQPDSLLPKLIIPVRYVSGGAVVQTTSTSLSKDLIHVRSARPPRAGLVLGLQLYFPNVREVVRSTGLVDDKRSADRIAVLLARHRDAGNRGYPRFHTHLRATIRRGEGSMADGY